MRTTQSTTCFPALLETAPHTLYTLKINFLLKSHLVNSPPFLVADTLICYDNYHASQLIVILPLHKYTKYFNLRFASPC